MLGISYFAMDQLAAAVEAPPHLRAIFALGATIDLYEVIMHHGLVSRSFVPGWMQGVAVTSSKDPAAFRGVLVNLAERVLKVPFVHARLQGIHGEALLKTLSSLMRASYEPEPWDRLYEQLVAEHPLRDAFWDARDVTPLLERVAVPVYLGCDWNNVPVHLPSTFHAWNALVDRGVPLRMSLVTRGALNWPWEGFHVEALAWYDHFLKGQDTGILEGPAIRYNIPPGEDAWHTCERWPPPRTSFVAYALRADGALATHEGEPGARAYLDLAPELARPQRQSADAAAVADLGDRRARGRVDVRGPHRARAGGLDHGDRHRVDRHALRCRRRRPRGARYGRLGARGPASRRSRAVA